MQNRSLLLYLRPQSSSLPKSRRTGIVFNRGDSHEILLTAPRGFCGGEYKFGTNLGVQRRSTSITRSCTTSTSSIRSAPRELCSSIFSEDVPWTAPLPPTASAIRRVALSLVSTPPARSSQGPSRRSLPGRLHICSSATRTRRSDRHNGRSAAIVLVESIEHADRLEFSPKQTAYHANNPSG
jgi:hypothetical protein